MPNQFLVMTMTAFLLWPSSVSMSRSMEISLDHCLCIRLLLLGSQGGASLSEVSPDSMDRWNWYTKLGPFFSTSSLDCNFWPNDNQTFIVYVKSTLVLYRMGLCGLSSFGICPGRKVMWSKVLQVLWTRGSSVFLLCLSVQSSTLSGPNQMI